MRAGEVGLSVPRASIEPCASAAKDVSAEPIGCPGMTCPVCMQVEFGGHTEQILCDCCNVSAHMVRARALLVLMPLKPCL